MLVCGFACHCTKFRLQQFGSRQRRSLSHPCLHSQRATERDTADDVTETALFVPRQAKCALTSTALPTPMEKICTPWSIKDWAAPGTAARLLEAPSVRTTRILGTALLFSRAPCAVLSVVEESADRALAVAIPLPSCVIFCICAITHENKQRRM